MYRILSALVLTMTVMCSSAKESPIAKDAAVWFNIYLEKAISKRVDLHLNQQNRFNNNVSSFGLWYADIGITYKLNKKVKFLGDYVFAQKQKKTYWSNRHQFYIAIYLNTKYARWKVTNRQMVQNGYSDVLTSENGKTSNLFYRNKLTLKREHTKYLSCYVAEELYLPLNDYRRNGLSRSRTFVGFFYSFSKSDELEFYFLFQNELNAFKRKSQDFVYGIGYSKKF